MQLLNILHWSQSDSHSLKLSITASFYIRNRWFLKFILLHMAPVHIFITSHFFFFSLVHVYIVELKKAPDLFTNRVDNQCLFSRCQEGKKCLYILFLSAQIARIVEHFSYLTNTCSGLCVFFLCLQRLMHFWVSLCRSRRFQDTLVTFTGLVWLVSWCSCDWPGPSNQWALSSSVQQQLCTRTTMCRAAWQKASSLTRPSPSAGIRSKILLFTPILGCWNISWVTVAFMTANAVWKLLSKGEVDMPSFT